MHFLCDCFVQEGAVWPAQGRMVCEAYVIEGIFDVIGKTRYD
jgi:hypothetical protein